MDDQGRAVSEVPPHEQQFPTLRELLAALGYESISDGELEGIVEEYADAYMDEDLGMNLFVTLDHECDGEVMVLRAKMSFYTEDAVNMWVLAAPFTVSGFHRYLDELDLRVRRLRAIVELPTAQEATDGVDDQVPIVVALAMLFESDERDVLAQLGNRWVPIESDVMGTDSAPARYLLWDDRVIVGLDDEHLHLFAPIIRDGEAKVGDVITSLALGEDETIGLTQFARALHDARGLG